MPKKNNDIKSLALQHAEKAVLLVVLGLVGLAVFSIASPYGGEPEEITTKVEKERAQLQASTWPPTDEVDEEFTLTEDEMPVSVVARELRKSVSPSAYEMEQRFYVPLYKTEQPLKEPEWLTVRELLADASTVIIPVEPDEDEDAEGESDETDEEMAEDDPLNAEDDSIPEELRTREGTGPVVSEGMGDGYGDGYDGGFGGYDGGYGGYTPEGMEFSGADEEFDDPYGGYDGGYGGMDGGGGESIGGGRSVQIVSNANGEGLQFVAVRGVFPKREQERRVAAALNVSLTEAKRRLELIDFELERKVMDLNQSADEVEWEAVDLTPSIEALSRALAPEPPVVLTSVTDPTITMEMPQRLRGQYGSKATHPQIENFELSDADRDLQTELIKRLRSEYAEIAPKKDDEKSELKKRGFQAAREAADMEAQLKAQAGATTTTNRYSSRGGNPLLDLFESDDKAFKEKMEEFLERRNSAGGELLLFRYLDFDVDPEMKYQYRVRLVLKNPNYGRSAAEAGGVPYVVEGETRQTEWSEPSTVAQTPSVSDYFVAGIIEGRRPSEPIDARISIYRWDPEYGTIVRGTLPLQPGQKIAGSRLTPVLDPAKRVYQEMEYEFETDDYLVAAIPDVEIDTRYHSDIELPPASQRRVGLPQAALIGNQKGRLEQIDQASSAEEKAQKDLFVKLERRDYEDTLVKHVSEASKKRKAREKQRNANPLGGSGYGYGGP